MRPSVGDPPSGPAAWIPNREDFTHVLRGLLMGGADVIPGVSGGTVALIVGIYGRLVTAISHVDGQFFHFLRQLQWRQAFAHIDLRFLIALGTGILVGVVGLGGVMHELLDHEATRGITLAAFFGMIVASARLVFLCVRAETVAESTRVWLLAAVAAAFAFAITGLPTSQAELTWIYLFFCGMVGICAMILPGLSGAYLLLILGVYTPLTGILKRLPRGNVALHDVVLVAVFASGCLLGLILFSKVLRWLLERHESVTMAILCGFMVGALRKIWPFQQRSVELAADGEHHVWQNVMPAAVDSQVVFCVVAAVAAGACVLIVDRYLRRHGERLRAF